jgi:SpoVK/Ycf46/Vps4 family AAA+-type ATPase
LILQINSLAEDAHGFVGADLSALCSEAAMAALRRLISSAGGANCAVTVEDFNYSKAIVRPSALREVILETPKVSRRYIHTQL